MPIRSERKGLYPRNWREISLRIRRDRAGWRCEWCEPDGRRCEAMQGQPHPVTGSKVVLTTAHLDHDETHADPERLRAWCQLHHLRFDSEHHRRNAAETRRRKMATAELFAGAADEPAEVPHAG